MKGGHHGARILQGFPRSVLCCVLREVAVSGRALERAHILQGKAGNTMGPHGNNQPVLSG